MAIAQETTRRRHEVPRPPPAPGHTRSPPTPRVPRRTRRRRRQSPRSGAAFGAAHPPAHGPGPVSRFSTPLTKPRWRHFVMRWREGLSTAWAEGARCPPTKRSFTHVAAATQTPHQRLACSPHRARSSDWSAKGSPTTTSPRGFSSHSHRANAAHRHLHQTRTHLARATRAGSCPAWLTDIDSCRFAT